MSSFATERLERRLEAAQALYTRAATVGERIAAKRAVDRLREKIKSFNGIDESLSTPKHTIDRIPIVDLGLGLGATVNGIDCKECSGKGYHEIRASQWITCGACDYGFVEVSKNGKPSHLRKCYLCNGVGTRPSRKRRHSVSFLKCSYCDGKGEREMFNPALRKGLLGT